MTTTTTAQLASIRRHISTFALRDLFTEDLGWDRVQMSPPAVAVAGATYTLRPLARKRGVVVFVCDPDASGGMPDYAARRAIDEQVAKLHREHFLIYCDRDRTQQIWQWVRRQHGKPAAYREQRYYNGQSGEALAQRLSELYVDLLEEETLTLPEAASRVQRAFDVERVTKRFYDRFKTEHAAFLAAIAGIADPEQRAWYASLMLNRLMFSYFIQKKGFLDGDTDYLRARLKQVQARFGPDQFDRFYREFLLHFFHDGLGKPEGDRNAAIRALLGRIPYLNGGLFEQHTIEAAHPALAIPDAAFVRVFDFFDAYSWHLDDRPTGADNEINPDVLGYIFEKYINQKQMGAYYTKEDITGYISRNTILPFLFDTARKDCKIAFEPDGEVWRLLRDDPDRYIYDAVRKGVDLDLPGDIAAGLEDVSRRGGWNRPADPAYALPTETWREHVARRRRCLDLRARLAAGAVTEINDLITDNLDIERFARDVIERCEGPELLRAVWKALERITVLDPTCGSGAFLFAALEILEPLYDACLVRMDAFVADFTRVGASEQKGSDFRRVLARVAEHPSRSYFIRKAIIINNLYGVDIMEEAVEIAKLRLFLSLVARAHTWEQIEPLPDIDFNIRAGNTLVGFATLDAVREAMMYGPRGQMRMLSAEDEAILARIDERAEIAARAFARFREMQSERGMAKSDFTAAKDDLKGRLADLRGELDAYLAREYGVDASDLFAFGPWRDRHQPFHWFVEFYGIVQSRGGFDVIIGNPPYVEYSKVRGVYRVKGYEVETCGNLYSLVMERSFTLLARNGRCGLITPVSLLCTERMIPLQNVLLRQGDSWACSFDMRPSSLFSGVSQRLTIILIAKGTGKSIRFGGYRRWTEEERDYLLVKTEYVSYPTSDFELGYAPKLATNIELAIAGKLRGMKIAALEAATHGTSVYVHRIVRYFVKALSYVPYFWNETDGCKKSEDYKVFTFKSEMAAVAGAMLNSSTFYWFWHTCSDGFHCGYRDVRAFGISHQPTEETMLALSDLYNRLNEDLHCNSVRRIAQSKATGRMEYDEIYPKHSKPIIDEIDRVLAEHYGFTAEELDFIINYDIKYRMGLENGEGNGNGNGGDGDEE